MKKNLISIALLTALTFMVGSCSDDDEPKPKVLDYLQVGTDSRPTNWTFSDNRDYESRMTVQVELGDTLAAYQSSMDLMCVTIDDEVCAVSGPRITGNIVYYPLIIFSNGENKMMSLHYYCDRLHRIYTINNWAVFNPPAAPTGSSGLYRPCFTSGK